MPESVASAATAPAFAIVSCHGTPSTFPDQMPLALTPAQSMQGSRPTRHPSPLFSLFECDHSRTDTARRDLAKIGSKGLQQRELPEANSELLEVIRNTESATNQIMESAEAIMSADAESPEEYATLVQGHVMTIFEACSFQDITGQRIQKVCDLLTKLSEQLNDLSETLGRDLLDDEAAPEETEKEKWRQENLINGPTKAEEASSQDEIDSLFD